jgi:exosortase
MTLQDSVRQYRHHLSFVVILLGTLYFTILKDLFRLFADNENYSHGFIVPVVAGYLLYQRWDDLKAARVEPAGLGLAVIVVGIVQLLLGWLGTEYLNMRLSLVVLLTGITLFLFGRRILMIAAQPLAYLLFMIPIPAIVYNEMAFPLKILVTNVSILALKAMGVIVWNEGNIIMLPTTTLEVADACSGLRSIMSLFALSTAYAFIGSFTRRSMLVLIVAAIPIAVAANIFRVIATGFLAQYWGAQAAEGFFHEFAGLAVFGMAMALLISLGALLKRFDR